MQTFTPVEYLKIDIASKFGLEGKDWDIRLAWFDDHENLLEEMVTAIDAGQPSDLIKDADDPALFYAGAKAYMKAKAGQDIAYPISLDATSSGAQLLSILIGCEKSARMCNVIDTGKREDFYTNAYEFMCERIEGTATKISRDNLKDAIMPWFYSSKELPKQVFGDGELLEIFYKTMEEEAPGIYQLNDALWTCRGLMPLQVLV